MNNVRAYIATLTEKAPTLAAETCKRESVKSRVSNVKVWRLSAKSKNETSEYQPSDLMAVLPNFCGLCRVMIRFPSSAEAVSLASSVES